MFSLKSLIAASLFAFASLCLAAPVNINTADAEALDSLPGIGPAKAAAIIEYRETNGSFKTVDELLEVNGVGSQTLEDNRSNLTVGEGA